MLHLVECVGLDEGVHPGLDARAGGGEEDPVAVLVQGRVQGGPALRTYDQGAGGVSWGRGASVH